MEQYARDMKTYNRTEEAQVENTKAIANMKEEESWTKVEPKRAKKTEDSESEEETTVTLTGTDVLEPKTKISLDLNEKMDEEPTVTQDKSKKLAEPKIVSVTDGMDLSVALKKKPATKKTKEKKT